MVPTPAIRNLIRDDKVHQIYGAMQAGQEKLGMQTANQSLASLYMKRLITLETALTASSNKDELQDMINRGVGVVAGAGLGRDRPARRRAPAASQTVEQDGRRYAELCLLRTDARGTDGQRRARRRLDGRGRRRAPARADPRHADHAGEGQGRGAPKKDARPARSARRSSAKNLAVFTRQFSVMIDAGLPLVQCLDILGSQEEDKNFAAVILQTRTDVESGASLADAMRKHPKTFDPLFTNMIAAGEAGGILDTILKRLATYIEKAVKLAGPGEVGDDLSDRRHRHRRRRRRRHSVEGHPDVRGAVRRASAPTCRCRRASSSR